jgi:DNA-directed RNA polymerase I, II, and III subunit RPABC1
MLDDRNYNVEKYIKEYPDVESFRKQFKNKDVPDVSILKFTVSKKDDAKDKLSIYWNDDEKIGTKVLKGYMDDMIKKSVKRGLCILKYTMSTFAKHTIEEFNHNTSNMYFETFDYSELMLNITKHILVPKHVVLSTTEVEELMAKYNLKKMTQLPKIHRTDPITKYFGLLPGSIVKVMRMNQVGSIYLTYRIVI